MVTIKLYTEGQNPGTVIDAELSDVTAESVAAALCEQMHDCLARTMLSDVGSGEVSVEEREDLTNVPGEQCFVYYMLPPCSYADDEESDCRQGVCNCEGDIFIATVTHNG